ncbi:MAG: SEL1-like repeat protein [Myxococcales bacterium]|nr:SEL1-like repeat protein [Myxococcales bacterium]
MVGRCRLLFVFVFVLVASACARREPPRDPRPLQRACVRALAANCPQATCRRDRYSCYRLGLWHQLGHGVPRDRERTRVLWSKLCDLAHAPSCHKLCRSGHGVRCVDSALLGAAGAGGMPYPPKLEWFMPALARGCKAGDTIACMMRALRYHGRRQRIVWLMNSCDADRRRCMRRGCAEGDPLACAVLCHVGHSASCTALIEAAQAGRGFSRPLPLLSSTLRSDRQR